MSIGDEIVGNRAAADYVGVSVNAWRPYVARGQAPKPDLPPVVEKGKALPRWRRSTLDAWKAARPGRGVGGGRKPKPRVD